MNMPRTKLIPNGDNIVHTFTDTEYENRQARLRPVSYTHLRAHET